jgi:hypothetical protein
MKLHAISICYLTIIVAVLVSSGRSPLQAADRDTWATSTSSADATHDKSYQWLSIAGHFGKLGNDRRGGVCADYLVCPALRHRLDTSKNPVAAFEVGVSIDYSYGITVGSLLMVEAFPGIRFFPQERGSVMPEFDAGFGGGLSYSSHRYVTPTLTKVYGFRVGAKKMLGRTFGVIVSFTQTHTGDTHDYSEYYTAYAIGIVFAL